MIRVLLPHKLTGRTLQTILQSLANGIKDGHMDDLQVKQLGIKNDTREIVILFRSDEDEDKGEQRPL